MMSLQQIRRDIEGLKESTKTRPLQVLLSCNAEDLTGLELTKLLMEVPIRQLPTSVFVLCSIEGEGLTLKTFRISRLDTLRR
jgi:hypothetical protein